MAAAPFVEVLWSTERPDFEYYASQPVDSNPIARYIAEFALAREGKLEGLTYTVPDDVRILMLAFPSRLVDFIDSGDAALHATLFLNAVEQLPLEAIMVHHENRPYCTESLRSFFSGINNCLDALGEHDHAAFDAFIEKFYDLDIPVSEWLWNTNLGAKAFSICADGASLEELQVETPFGRTFTYTADLLTSPFSVIIYTVKRHTLQARPAAFEAFSSRMLAHTFHHAASIYHTLDLLLKTGTPPDEYGVSWRRAKEMAADAVAQAMRESHDGWLLGLSKDLPGPVLFMDTLIGLQELGRAAAREHGLAESLTMHPLNAWIVSEALAEDSGIDLSLFAGDEWNSRLAGEVAKMRFYLEATSYLINAHLRDPR
ncbi:MAG TPA: hypothetical protein PKD72_05990, partial [Gemmatales bacterium]|nr:hypothetical protein [Gemmatales bacterium]